jgi:RNA polymerase sigma factor for flagellar operon FliA
MDWVPRSLRERISKIQHATNEWTKRKGHPPTEAELAESLGMETQEVDETLLQAKGAVVLSLDDLGSNEEDAHPILDVLADRDQPNPLESLVSEDARRALVDAIERLPDRQKLVLTLYYFEELTMKEIGVILHVTESRICQLHAQAMIKLKALLHTRLPR